MDRSLDTASCLPTSAGTIQNAVLSFKKFDVSAIPPHPVSPLIQRGGLISVHLKHLYLNAMQAQDIKAIYDDARHFHQLYSDSQVDQTQAQQILGVHGLDIMQLCQKEMKDLGSGWSRRWSIKEGKHPRIKQRVLLQW